MAAEALLISKTWIKTCNQRRLLSCKRLNALPGDLPRNGEK